MSSFGVGRLRAGVGRPRLEDEVASPPRVNVSFTREQRNWIARQANQRSCSVADVIRECVDAAIHSSPPKEG